VARLGEYSERSRGACAARPTTTAWAPPTVRGVVPSERTPRRGDFAVALVVGVLQVGGTYLASRHQPDRRAIDLLGFALLAAGPAALVVRRRMPVIALAVAFGSTLAFWEIGYARGPVFLALAVAFFTAVMAGRRAAAAISIVAGFVSFLWFGALLGREPSPGLGAVLALAAWLSVLSIGAEMARTRRAHMVEMARSRAEEARRRASEERMRIAQELHDVLAHNISLINVQAGVALHLMDERPEQVRTALTSIKQASREALSELRSVLEVLRQGGDELPRAPVAGLDDLDGLLQRAREAGLDVHLEVEGTPAPLPPEVDLAAFRIVQEALTNVTRHAGTPRAIVRIAYGTGDVTVQVDDDGQGAVAAPNGTDGDGGGNGIRGMKERASALGGELEAGPRSDGAGRGFRVRARLPLDAAASTR
jgi:signal transduction histidine kinase